MAGLSVPLGKTGWLCSCGRGGVVSSMEEAAKKSAKHDQKCERWRPSDAQK